MSQLTLFRYKLNHSIKSLMARTPVAKKLQLLKEKLSHQKISEAATRGVL